MTPSFLHAILHIDGDSFFASCEQARNPAWRGKPLITGKERGIAASMSIEAKALGVTRAMPLWEIKKKIPDVICLPSDYETYSLLSHRFYTIVRRFAGFAVEEYGIDECFADITGTQATTGRTYEQTAELLRDTLKQELGCSFSIGLAPNKVLAKLGSKWQKPFGLTVVRPSEITHFLQRLAPEKIWGIGPRTADKLTRRGVFTTLQFAQKSDWWVKQNFSRPILDIWRELNGECVMPLFLAEKTGQQSIQKFKTFTPPSKNPEFIFSQLSKNIENACIKLRRYNQATPNLILVLRTQDFRHAYIEVPLPHPTNLPPTMLPAARAAFDSIFIRQKLYRATGVIFYGLVPMVVQDDLFGTSIRTKKLARLYAGADIVCKKYGKHTLFLGTSFDAHRFGAHIYERGDEPIRKEVLFTGETKRKRIGIPMLFGDAV